jgi:SAM-dependent methyltransferase
MGRWRALGARAKAAHVEELCARAQLRPDTLVEIGCGDGALLAELSARGVASVLDGFELSAPAAELAAARAIPGVRAITAYDGSHLPAGDGAYDLAVLSHVLEHVPDPVPLLAEAARVASWVVVEVPLEANRSAGRPAKRAQAQEIGHLHRFDRAAVLRLVAAAGLRPVTTLADPLGRDHHAFFADSSRARAAAGAKWALRAGLHRTAPQAAERLFTVHFAVLAHRRATKLSSGAV